MIIPDFMSRVQVPTYKQVLVVVEVEETDQEVFMFIGEGIWADVDVCYDQNFIDSRYADCCSKMIGKTVDDQNIQVLVYDYYRRDSIL